MNNYNKTTKFLRKPLESTPLNSIDYNESKLLRQILPQWDKNNFCRS